MSTKKPEMSSRVAERYLATKDVRFSIVVKDDRSQLEVMRALDKALRTAGLNVVEVNHDSEKS